MTAMLRQRLWIVVLAALLLAGCNQVRTRDPQGVPTTAGEIHASLGLSYMQQGKNDVAMAKLKRALEFEPDLPEAHHYIAVLYERLGQLDLAEQHYQRALRLDAQNASLQNNYGTFLCNQSRFADSEKHFLAALKDPLYKNPDETYENLGLCALRTGEQSKADGYLRKALQINPKLPKSLFQMAVLEFEAARHLQARAYLQRYLEVGAHTPETLWLGIRNERVLGDKNAVASYALFLKRKFPDSEQARLLLESEGQ